MKTQNFGYIFCRDCGMEFNPADAVSGLCPECAKKRADHLAYLQTMYQSAVDGGDERTSHSGAQGRRGLIDQVLQGQPQERSQADVLTAATSAPPRAWPA